MMDVTQSPRGEVVIRIVGTFDAQAASRLSTWLGEVPLDGRLVVDFTEVRDFNDFGLAAVAGELAAHEALVVRGLTRHQERVLRYFGVDLSHPAGSAGAGSIG